jgi:hypothetical protein
MMDPGSAKGDLAVARGKISRRAFIGGVGGIGLSAALPSASGASAGASSSAWEDLAARLEGPLLRSGDGEYLTRAVPSALQYLLDSPSAVAVCRSATDVQRCIGFARENRVPFAIRGGGHSYSGYSTTSGLLIDMKGMQAVAFDPAKPEVTLGAGVLGAQAATGLRPHGAFVPIGSCPGVGISGFAMGGGFGWYVRQHGLGCDSLLEAKVVTADGVLRTCSATENSDLFWALRGGGGGNFGVLTQLKMATFPTTGAVSAARVTWRGGDPAAVVSSLQEALFDSPPGISLQIDVGTTTALYIGRSETPQIRLTLHNFGPASQIRSLLASTVATAPPALSLIADMGFWEAHAFLEADTLPTTGLWNTKSSFSQGPLPDAGISTMIENVATWPGSSMVNAGTALTLWSGAVSDVSPDATAFCHRAPGLLTVFRTSWGANDPSALIAKDNAWLQATYDDHQPYALAQSYQNWTDPALTDYLSAYYGTNLSRLVQVKRAYDPDDVFVFPQSIPTALPTAAQPAVLEPA